MIKNHKIITLCGSTKFKRAFQEFNAKLTTEENAIVLSVSLFGHADDHFGKMLTDDVKIKLDSIHKLKIDLSDEIFVLDVDKYIGESTRSEIQYALNNGKRIRKLSEEYPNWSDSDYKWAK